MVASLSLLSLALSTFSLVNARAVPRHTQPDGYVEGYLEKYSTYHERYLALECFKKHDTPFFELCCHPMLATENLKDNRDPSCDPANAGSSSSSEAAPTTSEVTQSATTEVTQSTTSEVTQSTPTEPAQPPAQFNNSGNDDNDDDLEDCDEEGEYDDDDDLEDCDEEETGGQEQGQSQSAPTTQAPPPPTTTAEQAPTTTSTTEQAPTSTTEQVSTSTTEQAPTSTAEQTPTTTSTTEQAPTSTTEEQVPPTTAAATTTTPEQSQPTQANGNGNQGGNQGGDLQLGGFATWYEQNGNAGSCGDKHGDDELIAAIDHERYGDLGQKSSLCGQRVSITNNNNGKSVTVLIADVCPTCNNGNSIDLSKGAFKAIADLNDGLVPISWKFV